MLNGSGYPIVETPIELCNLILSDSPPIPVLIREDEERSAKCAH